MYIGKAEIKSHCFNARSTGIFRFLALCSLIKDLPQDAQTEAFEVQPGDIIIIATDGLFDNLFDSDIQKICEMVLAYELGPEETCDKISKELVAKAVQKGWDDT